MIAHTDVQAETVFELELDAVRVLDLGIHEEVAAECGGRVPRVCRRGFGGWWRGLFIGVLSDEGEGIGGHHRGEGQGGRGGDHGFFHYWRFLLDEI